MGEEFGFFGAALETASRPVPPKEQAMRLLMAGPFGPLADSPELVALRDAARNHGGSSLEAAVAVQALADLLEERGDKERWLARWPWSLERRQRSSSPGAAPLEFWIVRLPPSCALPAGWRDLLDEVNECSNSSPLLGWRPGELKYKRAGERDLRFTVLHGRKPYGREDAKAVPGGFMGLAWLWAKANGKE